MLSRASLLATSLSIIGFCLLTLDWTDRYIPTTPRRPSDRLERTAVFCSSSQIYFTPRGSQVGVRLRPSVFPLTQKRRSVGIPLILVWKHASLCERVALGMPCPSSRTTRICTLEHLHIYVNACIHMHGFSHPPALSHEVH